jgi:hypothetical protein
MKRHNWVVARRIIACCMMDPYIYYKRAAIILCLAYGSKKDKELLYSRSYDDTITTFINLMSIPDNKFFSYVLSTSHTPELLLDLCRVVNARIMVGIKLSNLQLNILDLYVFKAAYTHGMVALNTISLYKPMANVRTSINNYVDSNAELESLVDNLIS